MRPAAHRAFIARPGHPALAPNQATAATPTTAPAVDHLMICPEVIAHRLQC